MLNREILLAGLLMVPSMILGVHLGNRTFNLISEASFRKLLALVMVIASARLLVIGMM